VFDTFEEMLLAMAVYRGMIPNDAAVAVLEELRAGGPRRPLKDVLVKKGLLKPSQVDTLAIAARKALAGKALARVKPPPQDPIPGYRVTGKLGSGGTAKVFLAEDKENGGRKVALKILLPAMAKDQKALGRFMREAELLVKFDHPNLAKGYNHGTYGPLAFLAMEFLDGETVHQILDREKSLPEARALEIVLEIAKALEYTQQQGIVHRDVKPDNVMVLKNGRIKLCDLGFALPIGQAVGEEGTTSGTVQYMSPEQARGQQDIDVRADIYSLGATLYHMVMGELPFAGGDSLEVMAKQVMEALNSSEIKNRSISKHMHYFIERMMSKEKDLRYATPKDLIDDINQQIEGFRSLTYRPDGENPASALGKP
jgi:serine/threonine-protein kinase